MEKSREPQGTQEEEPARQVSAGHEEVQLEANSALFKPGGHVVQAREPAVLYLPAGHTPEIPWYGVVGSQNMPALHTMQFDPEMQTAPVVSGALPEPPGK